MLSPLPLLAETHEHKQTAQLKQPSRGSAGDAYLGDETANLLLQTQLHEIAMNTITRLVVMAGSVIHTGLTFDSKSVKQ